MLTCKASRAQSALLHRKVTRVIFSLGGEMGSLWFSPSLPNESSDLVCRGCQCTAVQWPDLHLNEIKWLNIQEWNIVMIVAIKPQPPCSGERHSTWNCCHLGCYGALFAGNLWIMCSGTLWKTSIPDRQCTHFTFMERFLTCTKFSDPHKCADEHLYL